MNLDRRLHPAMLAMSVFFANYCSSVWATDDVPLLAETQAVQDDTGSEITIERSEIENTPVGNTDLSTLLSRESSVGVDLGQSGTRGGDLAPEQISIAGARPHQTQYMIGGVGTNNITTNASDTANSGTLNSGHPSGYYVDTSLMETVEVLERNINPEYGGFTGGAVNVELRKARDEFQAEYQYRMTDSSWNAEPKTSPGDAGFPNAAFGDGRYQPDYKKGFHSLHVSGAMTETQKMAVNFSVKESEIPLNNNGVKKDYGQSINNLFLTHELAMGQWDLQSDFRYSRFTSKDFLNNSDTDDTAQANSDSTNEHKGIGGTFKLTGHFDEGLWRTTLSYDQLKDERESEVDYLRTTNNYLDPIPVPTETILDGGYGNLAQIQDTWQLKSIFEFEPMYLHDTRHEVMLGIELVRQNASQERKEDYNALQFTDESNFGGIPSKTMGNWNLYKQGKVEVDSHRYTLFVNDQVSWDRLTVNVGGRAEKLSQFEKTVFAPRINGSWDFSIDRLNRLTVGANRYYSNDQLGWALRSAAKSLHEEYKNCKSINGDYSSNDLQDYNCDAPVTHTGADLNTADVPYSDEWSIEWQYEISGLTFKPGYMIRKHRDGLSTVSNGSELVNDVESESKIWGLSIHNTHPWFVVGANVTAFMNVTYEDRVGSGNSSFSYGGTNDLNSDYSDGWVLFDGQLMRSSEMDTSGYSSPWEVRFGFDMTWSQAGLTWSNIFNYEDGRKLTIWNGTTFVDGVQATVINSARMESLLTWDALIRWSPEYLVEHHASIELSVTNLLDKYAEVSAYGKDLGNFKPSTAYNKGREIWLAFTLRY